MLVRCCFEESVIFFGGGLSGCLGWVRLLALHCWRVISMLCCAVVRYPCFGAVIMCQWTL